MSPDNFPPDDLELRLDLPFSRHGLALDLLQSRTRPDSPVPAIIHLHGGAWVMFSKWAVDNVFLAREGYVTVSVDDRLAGEALFPAQIHDVKTAVWWLRAHARDLNIDPGSIGVWGVSAGAHLAGLLGVTAGTEAFEGLDGGWAGEESSVQAVGSVCGPMHLTDPSWRHEAGPFPLFGQPLSAVPAQAVAASPITYVSANAPAFAFVHGRQDEVVPAGQSQQMHQRLLKAGGSSELDLLAGGHEINMTHPAVMQRHLSRFFGTQLGRPEPGGRPASL
ncbi:alpha/beta hydrolase (plasmid) [Deinococcus taeanensis]|uniref:alpha/beta hydrolase n=1 Tax=Deinococcus taeanensis TaxID=2737050 RepID=UPI001CDB9E6C|nr:alpha/beta hydrolase [Deinococcus taeanensis]UBV44090.1 alpha/beta hydrolase [Deinococcus taeanensis]